MALTGTPLLRSSARKRGLGDRGADLIRATQASAGARFAEAQVPAKAVGALGQLKHRLEAGHEEAEPRRGGVAAIVD
jgi:hypothetical protein